MSAFFQEIQETSNFDIDTEIDLDELMGDHTLFNAFIYTSLPDAIQALEQRRNQPSLERKIIDSLQISIPEPFKLSPKMTILRYVVTPNYEISDFIKLVSSTKNFPLLLCEFTEDKFFPSNILKKFLGKIVFNNNRFSHTEGLLEYTFVIDFKHAEGKNISDLQTHWGQSLVEFHHEIFSYMYPDFKKNDFFDLSSWHKAYSERTSDHYDKLLGLFVRHGILFEDYILDKKEESSWIRNVFLPAFLKVFKITGYKPLIVPLVSEKIAGEKFWFHYPDSLKKIIETKNTKFLSICR